jgi:hypothetical protein
MDTISCDESSRGKKRAAVPCPPSMWWLYARMAVFSFWNTLLIGFIAVPAAVVAIGFGVPALTAFEFGWAASAVIFGTGLWFNQFEAWHHFALNLSIAGLLCDDERRLTRVSAGMAFVGIAFAFLGYLVAHWIAGAIYPFSLANSATFTSLGFGGDFFIEFLGMSLTTGIFLFSSSEYKGVWGVFGIAVVQGALIYIFGPATGGSFNFMNTLAVGLIEGNLSLSGWGPKLLATFVAPIWICIIKFFFVRSKPKM